MSEPLDLEELERLAKGATPYSTCTVIRYEHGGGRVFVANANTANRELVADYYQENNREFYLAANPESVLALILRVKELEGIKGIASEAVRQLAGWEARAKSAEARVTELEETFVDEGGTVWCRPTPEAYALACVALHKHRDRAEAAEARITELEAALAQAREDYHALYVQNMQTETALALKSRTPT